MTRAVVAVACLVLLGLVAGERINEQPGARRELKVAFNAAFGSGPSAVKLSTIPPVPKSIMNAFKRDVEGLLKRNIPSTKANFIVNKLVRNLTPKLSDFFGAAFIKIREETFKINVFFTVDLSRDVTMELIESVEPMLREAILAQFPEFVFPAAFPTTFQVLPEAVVKAIINSQSIFTTDSIGISALVATPIRTSLNRILNAIEPILPVPLPDPVPEPVPSPAAPLFSQAAPVPSPAAAVPSPPAPVPSPPAPVPSPPAPVPSPAAPGTVTVISSTPTSTNTFEASSSSGPTGSSGSASSTGFTGDVIVTAPTPPPPTPPSPSPPAPVPSPLAAPAPVVPSPSPPAPVSPSPASPSPVAPSPSPPAPVSPSPASPAPVAPSPSRTSRTTRLDFNDGGSILASLDSSKGAESVDLSEFIPEPSSSKVVKRVGGK